jgi:hypothetical protein
MPAPLEDLNRDHQCHFYQAPTGQRCGSPALKGEYYCYHHHIKHATRNQRRVLIDPEVTCMEIPPIEDRASIFYALAAVVHRLAENTIDTRRAGQMIYGLQVAMRALEPPPSQRCRTKHAAEAVSESQSAASSSPDPTTQPAADNLQPATPKTIQITKESLLYFLRSRHCYNCNAELFPASELTERRNPGAPPEIIEESNPRLPAPEPAADNLQPATVLPTLQAVASDPLSNLVPRTSKLAGPGPAPAIHTRTPALLYTHLGARYPRDLRAQSRRILACASHGPHRILNRRQTGERNGSS